MYTFSLEELEALSRMPLMSAEEAMRQEERKVMRKEIERLEKRLDRLIEKRHKMLFCAAPELKEEEPYSKQYFAVPGITDVKDKHRISAESKADRAMQKLKRSKAWLGNEYDIEWTKKNIKYLREELKGE